MLNLKRDERLSLSRDECDLVDLYRTLLTDDRRQLMRLASLLAEHLDLQNEGIAVPLSHTHPDI